MQPTQPTPINAPTQLMQDVVGPPPQPTSIPVIAPATVPQPLQQNMVGNIPVRLPSSAVPAAPSVVPVVTPAGAGDDDLDHLLQDVNKQIKKDPKPPSKAGILSFLGHKQSKSPANAPQAPIQTQLQSGPVKAPKSIKNLVVVGAAALVAIILVIAALSAFKPTPKVATTKNTVVNSAVKPVIVGPAVSSTVLDSFSQTVQDQLSSLNSQDFADQSASDAALGL
jgi:hypothetical protein